MTLPTPTDVFKWRTLAGRPVLVCTPLEPFATHLFTTAAWPLGQRTADSGSDSAWQDVAWALGIDDDRLVRGTQVHGHAVVVGTEAMTSRTRPAADIAMVREPHAAAAVQVADCVAMLFVDRITGAVTAAHAGWRGLLQRVPQVALETMRQKFGTRAANVLVAIGPSIGSCCYEVGPEVRAQFEAAGFKPGQLRRWFKDAPDVLRGNPTLARVLDQPRRPNHFFFDGWASVAEQIVNAGVPASQVFSPQLCTASHPEVFCSYRRDGSPSGRLVAAVRCESRP